MTDDEKENLEKYNKEFEAYFEQYKDQIEQIAIEADDILPEFQRVIARHNLKDETTRAAMMNAIVLNLVEFFVDNSKSGKMSPAEASTHWYAIAATMSSLVYTRLQEQHNRSLN